MLHFDYFSRPILITISIILLSLHEGKCAWKDDANMVLYQNKGNDDKTVEYWDHFDSFDEAQSLASAYGITPISWVCIKAGVFIFYDGLEFWADEPEQVKIYTGINRCTLPDPLGRLGSVRHAGSKFASVNIPQLVVFDGKYYSGQVYTIIDKSGRELAQVIPIKSMILIGPSKWTVTTYGDYKYCLVPYIDTETKIIQICTVSDALELLEKNSSLTWKTAVKGCDDSANLPKVNIISCFDYDNGVIQGPGVSLKLPSAGGGNLTSGESAFEGECSDFDEITQLLRWTLTHNFVTNYQFLLPLDKKHAWRAELIDVTFEAASTYLPDWLTETELLNQIREYYIYFAENSVWSKGASMSKSSASYDTLVAIQETKECINMLDNLNSNLVDREKRLSEIFENLPGPIFPEKLIHPSLRMSTELDPLMELVWLIMNLVAASCHFEKEFETNYWIDFTTTMNAMYLEPMMEQWTNPSIVKKYYPVILGGYDLNHQYDRIAVATTDMFQRIKFMNVFQRPEAVKKAITSLVVKV